MRSARVQTQLSTNGRGGTIKIEWCARARWLGQAHFEFCKDGHWAPLCLRRVIATWRHLYASARLHERSCFFAQLSTNCFSSCSCLLGYIFKHQFFNLMFDGDCRRKFDFSSEPVCAHWALLWPSTLYMGMTERKSHVARIIEILERDGQISRNQCLSMSPASTRLGALKMKKPCGIYAARSSRLSASL
jgi:hypothetical protein